MVQPLQTYIFEAVQIFIPLSADFTFVGLLLLHAKSTRIWCVRVRIDNGEGPIGIIVELLCLMSMSFVVSLKKVSELSDKRSFT